MKKFATLDILASAKALMDRSAEILLGRMFSYDEEEDEEPLVFYESKLVWRNLDDEDQYVGRCRVNV